jgi:hypothetical protein
MRARRYSQCPYSRHTQQRSPDIPGALNRYLFDKAHPSRSVPPGLLRYYEKEVSVFSGNWKLAACALLASSLIHHQKPCRFGKQPKTPKNFVVFGHFFLDDFYPQQNSYLKGN